MWTYDCITGNVYNPSNVFIGMAYSGNGAGLNNPAMENVANHGPIPRGQWSIGDFFDDLEPNPPDGLEHKGPQVCHLLPMEGTDTFGRSGFMIHGDNRALNQTASEGCIVAPRFVRERISESADRILQIV